MAGIESGIVQEMIKNIKVDQLAQMNRIQIKAEADLELLENLYEYTKKKAEIEAEYAKSLSKLNKGFSIKKMKKASKECKDGSNQDLSAITPSRPAIVAFLKMIEESEASASAREMISEKLSNDLAPSLKVSIKDKESIVKMNAYMQELHTSYDELERTKTQLDKAEKDLDSVKTKYNNILSNPKSAMNVLKSMVGSDVEERTEKLKSKVSEIEEKLAGASAEFYIAAETVNNQQEQYYNVDMRNMLQRIDGSFHDKVVSYIDLYANLESQYSSAVQIGMSSLQSLGRKIDQESDLNSFVAENGAIFHKADNFYSNSRVSASALSDTSKLILGARLSQFLFRKEECDGALAKKEKELAGLQQMVDVYTKTPQFGDAESPMEQLANVMNQVEYMRLQRLKLQKNIEIIETMGVAPVASDPNLDFKTHTLKSSSTLPKSNSISSMDIRHSTLSQSSTRASPSIPRKGPPPAIPNKEQVKALYDYTPSCDGELELRVGDVITITNKNTGSEAWWEGVSSKGKGQFPNNYVSPIEGEMERQGSTTSFVNRSLGNLHEGSIDGSRDSLNRSPSTPCLFKVKALYAYSGQENDELSFKENDIINVIHLIDSDWWKGTLNGKTGLLPKIYVEKLS